MTRAAESKLGGDLNVRHLKAGELLIKKGERAKEVFLIKEGRCVVVVDVDGEEAGAVCLFTPPPRVHSVLVHKTHRAHSLFTTTILEKKPT